MIVKVLQGVPFLVDSATKQIYAYEKPVPQTPLHLGSYDSATERFTLLPNWKDLYQAKLEAHRQIEKPRSRLPAAAAAPTQTR